MSISICEDFSCQKPHIPGPLRVHLPGSYQASYQGPITFHDGSPAKGPEIKLIDWKPEPAEHKLPGYHLKEIAKGELGKISKIQEELEELIDAEQQQNKIMVLCELSDLFGAMEAYLVGEFPGMTMQDLQVMSEATKRAFQNGRRK